MKSCENSVDCFGSKDSSNGRILIDLIDEVSPVTKLIVNLNNFFQFSDEVKEIHDVIIDCDQIRDLKLNFRSFYICSANLIFICQVIESLPRLNELTVFFIMKIGTKVTSLLGKSISNKRGILTRLKLDFEYSVIGFEGIASLTDGIISNAKQLQFLSLILRNNKVTDEMIKTLGRAISHCNQLKELELDLKGNSITLNAFEELCDSIEICLRIEILNLSINNSKNLSNSCMKFIGKVVKAFSMQLKSLELNLKQNYYIQTSGIQELYESMKDCSKLEKLSLKLSLNVQQTVGIPSIAKAIELYPSLTELRLVVNWDTLQDEDILKWIIKAVDSRSLTLRILSLDLPSNNIHPTGMKALLGSIHKCKSLLFLDLNTQQNRMEEILRLSKCNLYKLKYLIKINVYCYYDYYENNDDY